RLVCSTYTANTWGQAGTPRSLRSGGRAMDLSVITTYRCNSRCSMCNIWKHPTHPDYELDIATLEKLPGGFDHINVTGGEPTLRTDLLDICDALHPKAKTLEISTNGLRGYVLEKVIERYPDVKIRISVEGFEGTNDTIRGEKGGFEKKMEAMERRRAAPTSDSPPRFRTRTSTRSCRCIRCLSASKSSSPPRRSTTRSNSTRTTTRSTTAYAWPSG